MLYAVLCYNNEDEVFAWSKEQEGTVMTALGKVNERLAREGKLSPIARLMPTTTATTLRKDREPALITDGPYAETKEALLGFYVIDCASLEEIHAIARELGGCNPGGAFEIRPLLYYAPGTTGT